MTTRKLEELLALESYQDMSDEEIESVISFKVSMAVKSEELQQKTDAIKAELNARIEAEHAFQDKVYSLFAAQIESKPELQVIDYGQKE